MVKVSELPLDDAIGGAEIMPVLDAGTSKRIDPDMVAEFIIDTIEAITPAVAVDGNDSIIIIDNTDGELKPVDIDLVAQHGIDTMWAKPAETAVDGADVMLLKDGATEKTVTAAKLAEYMLGGLESDILDVSDLPNGTGTLSAADLLLINQGGAAKYTTVTGLNSVVYAGLKTRTLALPTVTVAAQTDVFYVIQGGVEKQATLETIRNFFGNPVGGPESTTENYIPQWDATDGELKDGLAKVVSLDGENGTDNQIPTAKAVEDRLSLGFRIEEDNVLHLGDATDDEVTVAFDGTNVVIRVRDNDNVAGSSHILTRSGINVYADSDEAAIVDVRANASATGYSRGARIYLRNWNGDVGQLSMYGDESYGDERDEAMTLISAGDFVIYNSDTYLLACDLFIKTGDINIRQNGKLVLDYNTTNDSAIWCDGTTMFLGAETNDNAQSSGDRMIAQNDNGVYIFGSTTGVAQLTIRSPLAAQTPTYGYALINMWNQEGDQAQIQLNDDTVGSPGDKRRRSLMLTNQAGGSVSIYATPLRIISTYMDFTEIASPGNPADAQTGRLWVGDLGGGGSKLMFRDVNGEGDLDIGGGIECGGRVYIDGKQDEKQLIVEGLTGQTSQIMVVQEGDGSDRFVVAPGSVSVYTGNLNLHGIDAIDDPRFSFEEFGGNIRARLAYSVSGDRFEIYTDDVSGSNTLRFIIDGEQNDTQVYVGHTTGDAAFNVNNELNAVSRVPFAIYGADAQTAQHYKIVDYSNDVISELYPQGWLFVRGRSDSDARFTISSQYASGTAPSRFYMQNDQGTNNHYYVQRMPSNSATPGVQFQLNDSIASQYAFQWYFAGAGACMALRKHSGDDFGDLIIGDNVNTATANARLDVRGTGYFQGVLEAAAGIKVLQDTTNIAGAVPTDSELDAAFGQPAALGDGFVATLDDNGAGTTSFVVWTSGGAWFHAAGTKAV